MYPVLKRFRTRRGAWVAGGLAILLSLGSPPALEGQETPETRALAGALLRVEYALKGRPPAPEAVGEVNLAFDRATLAFFAGRLEVVVAAMDSLAEALEPDPVVRATQRESAERVLEGLGEKVRVLEGDHPPIPYRLHGPPPDAAGPFPVLVSLHGAGGNEHMFLEAYGAGRLRELAEERGFVVISPSTNALAMVPQALPRLLAAAEEEFPIRRGPVAVLGHSMGAGAAWRLAGSFGETIGAVACVAGPCGAPGPAEAGGEGPSRPPLLVVAGELDPIAAPPRLEAAVRQGQEAGFRVEYRVISHYGHTLVVGAVLEDVVDWLLAHLSGI
jgi:predicted esterase